jgi:GINS complex subunit 3
LLGVGAMLTTVLVPSSNIVSLSKPKAYSARVKAALDANPTSVQLRHQNVHWYALGMRLAQL